MDSGYNISQEIEYRREENKLITMSKAYAMVRETLKVLEKALPKNEKQVSVKSRAIPGH